MIPFNQNYLVDFSLNNSCSLCFLNRSVLSFDIKKIGKIVVTAVLIRVAE